MPRVRTEAWLFHVLMLGFILATRLVYTPIRRLSADNGWHFQFAQDVLAWRPIYWSAVDANRMFPDLLFGILAALMPGGADFQTWTYWFYAIVFIATYLSLIALATVLFDEIRERRAFLVVTVLALWLVVLATPFWGGWIFDPGNHGTGLPVCILCLALAIAMFRRGAVNWKRGMALVALASLVVASNRFLLVGFLCPMLAAVLLAGAAQAWTASRRATTPRPLWREPFLVLATVIAMAGLLGYLGWMAESTLSWHRLVQKAPLPPWPASIPTWFMERLQHESAEYAGASQRNWEIPYAIVFLAIVALFGAWASRTLVAGTEPHSARVGRGFFGLAVTLCIVFGALFVTFIASEEGDWHYRFLTVPLALAVVFFAGLWARMPVLTVNPSMAAMLGGLAVIGLTQIETLVKPHPIAVENAAFQKAVDDLVHRLSSHSSERPLKGISEYWLANDINLRTREIQFEVATHDTMELRFYNNNAQRYCQGGQFFVLRDANRDEPRMSAILAKLGPPKSTETINMVAYPKVEILYYDPDHIEDRLLKEARQSAAARFPDFQCRTRAAQSRRP